MFSRKACYFFVRPKASRLEVVIFLGRTMKAPQVKTTTATSRTKVAHVIHIRHRDEVEPPLTDWLREAYDVSLGLSAPASRRTITRKTTANTKKRSVSRNRGVRKKGGGGTGRQTPAKKR
jgi:hypothetical protein